MNNVPNFVENKVLYCIAILKSALQSCIGVNAYPVMVAVLLINGFIVSNKLDWGYCIL